jgi:hypothetical protein
MSNERAMNAGARIRRAEGVVLRTVAGERMLVPTVAREVDLDSLYLLNDTGAYVWDRLDGEATTDELGQEVAAHFGADAGTVASDVVAFLEDLTERRLAVRLDGDGV